MTDLPARIQVQVTSLAKPIPEALLAARTAIRGSSALQAVFEQAKAEGWASERLADSLYVRLPEYLLVEGDLWDTALYLADEYLQLGDCLLLVSKETGQAIAKLREDDIYLPASVARETGDGSTRLAQPLPRLRPDLEGLLVELAFTKGRENQLTTALASSLHQTPALRGDGDPRLLRVTRRGRKEIVDRLRIDLPTFLQSGTGVVKDFLNLFTFCTGPHHSIPIAPCTGFAKVLIPVADPRTFNFRHDPYTALRGQITGKWARDIALVLASEKYALGFIEEASVWGDLPNGFWIANPSTAVVLTGKTVLPVEGAPTVLLRNPPVAQIWIRPDSYRCESREFLDRWEVAASFEFVLYLDTSKLSVYNLKEVPELGFHAEVVA